MKAISSALAGLAVFVLIGAGATASDAPFGPWGYDLGARDTAVKPSDDFAAYANGSWLRRTEIPADRWNISMHTMLDERVLLQLRTIMESAGEADPDTTEGKVGAYYAAFMDETRIQALGAAPLMASLDAVRAAGSREALAALMGRTNKDFEGSLFSIAVEPDGKDPAHYAIHLGQAALGMPARDYFLQPSFAEKKLAYQAYVANLLALEGWPDAEKSAAAVVAFETSIAQASWSRVEQRDVVASYNPMTLPALEAMAPGFDWRAFLRAADLGVPKKLVVVEKTAILKIAALFASADLDTLRSWQAFKIANNAAYFLSKPFSDAYHEFHDKVIFGQVEQKPRWKLAVHAVGGGDILTGIRSEYFGAMVWAVGDLYVAKHFSPATKAAARTLMAQLKNAMRRRIARLAWMGPGTKARALAKLAALTVKIGSPEHRRDYSSLVIARDDLLGDVRRVAAFDWAIESARPGKAVDRDDWEESPQSVNDYEDSIRNEVAFPAAYLQAPLFDPTADAAVTFGAAGLMAHELTHDFDDKGRRYDAEGRIFDWWSADDSRVFENRTKALGDQYSRFEALPGLYVNGRQTMGENIADLGGLLIAYDAYRASLHGKDPPVLDGLTGDQRFFLGWAQVWRQKFSDDAMRRRLVGDAHSPPGARTDIPLQNIDAWYRAFGVKPGDKLYLPPDKRVKIW